VRNLVLYHIFSGHAFFSGVGLLSIAILLSSFSARRESRIRWTSLCVLSLVLVTVSAPPLPKAFHILATFLTSGWLVIELTRRSPKWLRVGSRIAVALVWGAAVVLEIPYHWIPRLPPLGNRPIYVIGDSVSEGTGEAANETWPMILSREHSVQVRNLARVAGTAKSARQQAGLIDRSHAVVIVEIGGNDILEGTPPEEFEGALDALLSQLKADGHVVVMLELPLLPLSLSYGRIQRRAAARHGVLLVPKRLLVGVLTTAGSTLDSIHLSRSGHAVMAGNIWEVIRPTYGR
jgi:acyl-CoA thioesterase I